MSLIGLLVYLLSGTAHAGCGDLTCHDACILDGDVLTADFQDADRVKVTVAVSGDDVGCTGTVWSGAATVDFCCAFPDADLDHVEILGSPGDDSLRASDRAGHSIGTASALINGLGGDDTIRGSDGIDLLYGGPGMDIIGGNGGNDTICGEDDTGVGDWSNLCVRTRSYATDADVLVGGSGHDKLCDYEAAEDQYFNGGIGDDQLWLSATGAGGSFTSDTTCGAGLDSAGNADFGHFPGPWSGCTTTLPTERNPCEAL